MDGVLNINKPSGMTSHDVVQAVRRITGEKRVGHTGTLDPLATGLLPICFGEATKFSTGLLDADKSYRALVKLGQTSTELVCDPDKWLIYLPCILHVAWVLNDFVKTNQ